MILQTPGSPIPFYIHETTLKSKMFLLCPQLYRPVQLHPIYFGEQSQMICINNRATIL